MSRISPDAALPGNLGLQQLSALAGPKHVPESLSDVQLDSYNLNFTIIQSIRNTPAIYLVVGFIAVSFWPHCGPVKTIAWTSLVLLTFLLRVRLLRPACNIAEIQKSPDVWRSRYAWSTVGCGALVGLGPALFFPLNDDISRMYQTMVFCCWLAGAMASLGARRNVFIGYTACFVGGVWIGWLRSGSLHVTEISLLLLSFCVIIVGFTRGFSSQVNASIEMRFRNEQLVAQLNAAREAAEQASDAKSRFLAVASHDLRQPLHAVTLLNGLLARPQPPDRVGEISQQMSRALSSLEKLFSSVLDFSKLEVEKIKPVLEWVELQPLMQRLAQEYSQQASAKGLGLHFADMPWAVHADPQLLERIVRNLLDNALKFTQNGSVQIALVQRESGLMLSVCDTGPGIPGNLRGEIFKEYYQANRDSGKAGLGLGLTIVQRLAALLSWSVSVTDNSGGGARFDLLIPVSGVRAAAAPGKLNTPPVAALDLTGYFVVMIDDDPFARDAVRLLLTDWGCKTVIAESLGQAMALLAGQPVPDVVLSDFSLGEGQTGLQVMEAMRDKFGPISGAILSGETSVAQLHAEGEIEYPVLQKPVLAKDLRALLEVFKELG